MRKYAGKRFFEYKDWNRQQIEEPVDGAKGYIKYVADHGKNLDPVHMLYTGANNNFLCSAEHANNYREFREKRGYLTFSCLASGGISLSKYGGCNPNLEYSLNGGWSWIPWDGTNVALVPGQNMMLRGINPSGFSMSDSIVCNFNMTGIIAASGNIMSLIDGQPDGTKVIPCSYCFYSLFYECLSLISAPELHATALAPYCYINMFWGCTCLTAAPELPATALSPYCYNEMFYGCTGLTSAPSILPATTLASHCYNNMFKGCSSLTSVPALPATSLAEGCYRSMFQGCTGLTSAPALPATTLANYCYSYMFESCTTLITAPELPATILVESCYYSMFENCTSLNYIKCLAVDTSASVCLSDFTLHVAETGTFIKNPNKLDWPIGTNGIPDDWTLKNDVQDYLTFKCISSANIGIEEVDMDMAESNGFKRIELEYSVNNGPWQIFKGTTNGTTILASLQPNDIIKFRGDNQAGTSFYVNSGHNAYNRFVIQNGKVEASGSVFSIINKDSFNKISICPWVIEGTGNYGVNLNRLFYECANLLTPPTLGENLRYDYGNRVYEKMFSCCTDLKWGPAINIAQLSEITFKETFEGCTSIKYIACRATNHSISTQNWLTSASASGVLAVASGSTWATSVSGIPSGWTRGTITTNI